MVQFLVGFIVAVAVFLPVAVLLVRRRSTARAEIQPGNREAATGSRCSEKEVVAQLEELSKLTAGLAHEIKNPLSTIKVNLKLVSEELDKYSGGVSKAASRGGNDPILARALRKIAVVQKETDRLELILEEFLRYVTQPRLRTAPTDINELISDMVDFYSPQAYSRSITIRTALHNEPLVCKVDADMLKQVILNLFLNAQQAMSNGGELMIKTARENGYAIIRITDTGTGIAPEKLEKVFEAYYSTRPGGSGLGLAMAKRIVEAHKGTITVESALGKGTAFTIRLPEDS